MARTREWDEEQVLGTVMRTFRERGYAAVTVRELETASGVHTAGLYHAYGSKDGIFAAALAWYNDRVVRRRIAEHLDREEAPLAGIRAYFLTALPSSPDPGCLLTNTAVESYARDAATRAAVTDGLRAIRDGFERALTRAKAQGDIAAWVVATEAAAQLLALYQGVLVLVRAGTPHAELARLVDGALDALRPTEERDHQ